MTGVSIRRGFILIFLCATTLVQGQLITVDTSVTFQTIQGWECGTELAVMPDENIGTDTAIQYVKDEVAQLMVDSMGVTRVRLEVRSGSENPRDTWQELMNGQIDYEDWQGLRYSAVNDNATPASLNWNGFHFSELDVKIHNAVLPLLKQLEKNGGELYVNLCYVSFLEDHQVEGFLHRDPNEYAEFMLAVFQHMERTFGFVPDGVEVILEPGLAQFGDGRIVGECMVAAGEVLEKHGYAPEFIAPSSTNLIAAASPNMVGRFLDVDGVEKYWSEYSYHAYGGRTEENLIKIADIAARYDVRTAMLEWWNPGNTFFRLHADLTKGNNSAWEFRFSPLAPASTQYGNFAIDWNGKDDYQIDMRSHTKYISEYFRAIRPGAVRVSAVSDQEVANPVTFVNPDGRLVLIIAMTQKGKVRVKNLPPGRYAVTYTTGNGYAEPIEYRHRFSTPTIRAGKLLRASIPDQGLIVISQEPAWSSTEDSGRK
ncbi:hypothetical protein KUV50_02055 [Membranicola marinus]|uniref:Uncharacterized protein n=1 Tax=Membranihabitans marinus TaxID=1227546 RepID=A0A953HR75_9BACT|nr:hypothetical protein [Membranihabitans marinus]MBY5956900.1 hypothetical protein [Membranihabitans marinus]